MAGPRPAGAGGLTPNPSPGRTGASLPAHAGWAEQGGGVAGWLARGLFPTGLPSQVLASAWGRLCTAAPEGFSAPYAGEAAALWLLSGPEAGALGARAPAQVGPSFPGGRALSPPPVPPHGVRAPGPERGRAETPGRRRCRRAFPGPRGAARGWRGEGGGPGRPKRGDKSVSARPPPAPAETSLSGGAARRARPAQPPATRPQTPPPRPGRRRAPGRPRAEPLGSWTAGPGAPGAASSRGRRAPPHSGRAGPQGHPDGEVFRRAAWLILQIRAPVQLYYLTAGGTGVQADCPKAAP